MAVDEGTFKLAMSHFASGVTVVTTEHAGRRYGMTVASFASLSLRPPLVLICIEKNVQSHDAIAAAKKFGVSILAEGQEDISNRFASKSDDKFTGLEMTTGSSGVPLVPGALCVIECQVREQLAGGDHSIFVGEVTAAQADGGRPLLYFRSGYRQINF